jgi:hypothetical protein
MTAFNFRLRSSPTKRIILHSSHTGPSITKTVTWLRVKGRERGLLDVGYHFVIERDGWVTETCPRECMGSHAPGMNHDSLGICFAGKRNEYPTQEQVNALGILVEELGPSLPIVGHCEVQRFKGRDPSPAFDLNMLRYDLKDRIRNNMLTTKSLVPPTSTAALSPQQSLVIQYLQAGRSLTNLIALTNLGVGSLTSRVAELRTLGYQIIGENRKDFNGKDYVSYTLRKGAGEAAVHVQD